MAPKLNPHAAIFVPANIPRPIPVKVLPIPRPIPVKTADAAFLDEILALLMRR